MQYTSYFDPWIQKYVCVCVCVYADVSIPAHLSWRLGVKAHTLTRKLSPSLHSYKLTPSVLLNSVNSGHNFIVNLINVQVMKINHDCLIFSKLGKMIRCLTDVSWLYCRTLGYVRNSVVMWAPSPELVRLKDTALVLVDPTMTESCLMQNDKVNNMQAWHIFLSWQTLLIIFK